MVLFSTERPNRNFPMPGYKEKVPGIASRRNRQRLGRDEPVASPCVWRDVHRMIAEWHEVLLS